MYGLNETVLESIIKLAKKCGIRKLLLFGSRARGDYKSRSDIDLAVSGGDVIRFSVDIDDYVPTLLMFDVVNLDGVVQQELLDAIAKDGQVIYEKV